MARIKRPIKYSIIFTALFLLYFMLIDKYAVDVEIHSNSDAIEDFPREYAKLKEEEQQANGLDLLETKHNL